MSREDGGFYLPMSYPVDADELAFALYRVIERNRVAKLRALEEDYAYYVNGASHALCQCGGHRRTVEDAQIEMPEVQMMPESDPELDFPELCKQILLANGYLLPILLIMVFIFYLGMISID